MKVTRHPVSEFLKAVTIIGHFAVIMRHNQNATKDCLLLIKSTSPGFLLYSFFFVFDSGGSRFPETANFGNRED